MPVTRPVALSLCLVVAAVAPSCVQPAWGQGHPTPARDAGARDAGGRTGRDAGRDVSALAPLMGDTIGENFGFGGLGLRGSSPARDTSAAPAGLGNLERIGHGAGPGLGGSMGSGMGRMHTSGAPSLQLALGETTTRDAGLTPDMVRRVFVRGRAAMAYCFARSPGVADAGVPSATLRFTVRPDGAVAPVDLTVRVTAGGPDVPGCLRARVLSMMFPPTQDRAVVTVTQALAVTPTR